MEPLEARDLFPIASQWNFQNHAGTAPMSLRSRAAVETVVNDLTRAPRRQDRFLEDMERLRRTLARLIGGSPDGLAVTRGTAHGLSLLARGLDWQAGDNIVSARLEYPANLYPWMAQAGRGVELRLVEPDGGRVTPEAVFALMDERTRVVALSSVQFWNGYRLDIARIGAECRSRGIILSVDAIQSVGVLETDVEAMQVDLLAAGAGKWMMGPVGIGLAWFAPILLERIEPLLVGTGSVTKNTEYFRPELEWAPTARKFEESTISWMDLVAFLAAAELLLEIGMDKVEERVLALAGRLGDGLVERGFEVWAPWPRKRSESSGIISFRKPGSAPEEQLRDLTAARVACRTHADYVRLSPHFYNTVQEIDRILDVLTPERAAP